MRHATRFTALLSRLGLLALPALLLAACSAAGARAPTSNPAANTPDQFAWQLFTQLNQPIPNDPQGRVAWEGWALASDVFADPNATPDWDALTAAPLTADQFAPMPLQQMFAHPADALSPQFDPQASPFGGNETRLNRAAFDFIVANQLWYVEGQEAMFAQNRPVVFPIDAKEVKAQWRLVTRADAPLFHTVTLTNTDGQVEIWGLTALHITTKDLPNWFWATFEHKSNPNIDAVIPTHDSAGLPPQLVGTVWENYVLRGTQIDFVDATGRPTRLANSQIEAGFEATSSCITCHARSTIGAPRPGQEQFANRLSIFGGVDPVTGQIVGNLGAPDPAWFYTADPVPAAKYLQLDFVWSLFRAQRRNP